MEIFGIRLRNYELGGNLRSNFLMELTSGHAKSVSRLSDVVPAISISRNIHEHWGGSRTAPTRTMLFYSLAVPYFFAIPSKNGLNKSIGTGKMVVELRSLATSTNVCK